MLKKNYLIFIAEYRDFFIDKLSRRLFFGSLVFALFDYIIWARYLNSPDVFIYLRLKIYPVQYMALILVINTILAIVSFKREKEISYLLLMANLIVGFLTLALEFFYLFNLK